ncbi:hypothetical protein [Streptomyces sp. NPDC050255]|uniref:hypothetical protein n=1 Tax=Streptomyces sp. NPDC050255 TaxID=3365606 RepID=UPI00379A0008
MTTPNELRLLPWSGPGGKPCYLSTDDPDSYMSRLADNVEAAQLGTAAAMLEAVAETFADRGANMNDLGHVLTDSLRDVLRVATSRGHLLAASEPHRI